MLGLVLDLKDGTLLDKLLGTEDGCEVQELELYVMLGLEDSKEKGKPLGNQPS